jgi:Icc-related predicted phosphoesterase
MKIIALSDIHGKTASLASLGDTLSSADLILIAGDITHFRGKEALSSILDEIKKFNDSIYAVFGNCDLPEVENGLQDAGIALHRRQVSSRGIVLAGLGGSLPCPGKTPNEFGEETFKKMLEDHCFSSLPEGGFVFVTHQPPVNTKADKAWTGGHVGSGSIRDFIEAKRPFLCLTGHIHE